jgi:hypothetical protein
MNTALVRQSPLTRKILGGLASTLIGRSVSTYKDLATVSVSMTYTTKSDPTPRTKMVDLNFYAGDLKGSKFRAIRNLKRNEIRSDSNMVVYDNMGNYKWKVIWLDEMGEERVTYHESEAERNAKLQSLVDDGYSPVFREIQ